MKAPDKFCAGCKGKLWKRGDHRAVVTYRRKLWHDDCATKHPLWWRDFVAYSRKVLGSREISDKAWAQNEKARS